jgi:hypothetical protein
MYWVGFVFGLGFDTATEVRDVRDVSDRQRALRPGWLARHHSSDVGARLVGVCAAVCAAVHVGDDDDRYVRRPARALGHRQIHCREAAVLQHRCVGALRARECAVTRGFVEGVTALATLLALVAAIMQAMSLVVSTYPVSADSGRLRLHIFLPTTSRRMMARKTPLSSHSGARCRQSTSACSSLPYSCSASWVWC